MLSGISDLISMDPFWKAICVAVECNYSFSYNPCIEGWCYRSDKPPQPDNCHSSYYFIGQLLL